MLDGHVGGEAVASAVLRVMQRREVEGGEEGLHRGEAVRAQLRRAASIRLGSGSESG
mgnify:CR=1 FL=1|jgi:hypothetical protein